MKNETNIHVGKADRVEAIVERVIHAPTFLVILTIPKDTALGHSQSHFNALKREAETAGKALAVESSDESVLEKARKAKIHATLPERKVPQRPITDIVRKTPKDIHEHVHDEHEEGVHETVRVEDEVKDVRVVEAKDVFEKKAPTFFKTFSHEETHRELHAVAKPESAPRIPKFAWSKKVVGITAASLTVFVGGIVLAALYLPRATVALSLKRTTAQGDFTFQIGKDVRKVTVSGSSIKIPGELFVEKGNTVMKFPASGKEVAESSAKGTITIYNAYGTAPQTLVKSTRFESQDGKIFRLDGQVVVPGAKMVGGKLQPSSIDAPVTADKSGDAFNVPAGHWTIPGFAANDKRFKGFYGESADSMKGGATGERPVMSDSDREAAHTKVSDALRSTLGLRIQAMSDKFTVFPSSTEFRITKTEERMSANDPNSFDLYMEGELRQIVLDESVVKGAIAESLMSDETKDDKVERVTVEYGTPQFDFDNGTISGDMKGGVTFAPNIDLNEVQSLISGLKKGAAEMRIGSLKDVTGAEIKLSPFWVGSIPSDLSRVTIVLQ